MIDPEHLLSAVFDRLVDDPDAPLSTIDTDRALVSGRRAARTRRRRVGASGVGAAVLAALIAVPVLLPGKPPPPPSVGSAGIDPLSLRAEFGWLPTTDLTAKMYQSDLADHSWVTTVYDPTPVGTSSVTRQAQLMIETVPSEVPSGGNVVGTVSRIGTLNGAPVTMDVAPLQTDSVWSGGLTAPTPCLPAPTGTPTTSDRPSTIAQQGVTSYGSVEVDWRTAAGWDATIMYLYADQPAPDAAAMLHMLNTVTIDTTALPIAMPFSVSGLASAPWVSAEQGRYHNGYPHYFRLSFIEDKVFLSIDVDGPVGEQDGCLAPRAARAVQTINGVTFQVTVGASAQEPGTKGPPVDIYRFGTPSQILSRITSFGTNPLDWTTHVLQP